MRSWMCRIALSLPVMIVLGFTEDVRAEHRTWAAGIGVGVGVYGGPGFGPYWGPAWGFMPNYTYFNGSWGNGLSMYGPPVPTGKPVPGMFGGGDSRFFAPPPLYPGWLYGVYIPLNQPATLPRGVWETFPSAGLPTPANELPRPAEVVPPPAPVLENPSTLEIEVRLPHEDARLFIDGQPTKSSGAIRKFATPTQHAYRNVDL